MGLQRRNSEIKQVSVTHAMMRTSSRKYAGPNRVAGPHMPPPTCKRPAASAYPTSIKYKDRQTRTSRKVGSAHTDTDTARPSMARTTPRPTSQPKEESPDSVHYEGLTPPEGDVSKARPRGRT